MKQKEEISVKIFSSESRVTTYQSPYLKVGKHWGNGMTVTPKFLGLSSMNVCLKIYKIS